MESDRSKFAANFASLLATSWARPAATMQYVPDFMIYTRTDGRTQQSHFYDSLATHPDLRWLQRSSIGRTAELAVAACNQRSS